jgi:hypothetical protein
MFSEHLNHNWTARMQPVKLPECPPNWAATKADDEVIRAGALSCRSLVKEGYFVEWIRLLLRLDETAASRVDSSDGEVRLSSQEQVLRNEI